MPDSEFPEQNSPTVREEEDSRDERDGESESDRNLAEADPERSPESSEVARLFDPDSIPWKGYEKLRLIRDLALGEFSTRELTHRYDPCSEADIENFRQDYSDEIAEVKQALSGMASLDTAGLWVAKKPNRIAEYQNQAEEIRAFMQDLRDQGIYWSRAHRDMLRSYLELLRAVADELGAYPQRQQIPQKSEAAVHYVIDTGTKTEDLT